MKKLLSLLLLLSFTIKAQDVTIGTQTWTSKNLDVEIYRNGEEIPQVKDKEEWANLTTGAWCYYKNKTANGKKYGKLYNWYAVNDPRGLAPKGYHIPTDAEWTMLTDYLDGEPVAGTKMKSTSGWQNNKLDGTTGNGTNISVFTGLPGGFRVSRGDYFFNVGYNGYGWSSSVSNTDVPWCRALGTMYGAVDRLDEVFGTNKRQGFSVRCIKD